MTNTRVELVDKRRDGLVGANGCGKTTFLCALAQREFTIPEHISIYHLAQEVPPSDLTPMQIVGACDSEREELEAEADRMVDAGEGLDDGRLDDIYERLDQVRTTSLRQNTAMLHTIGGEMLMPKGVALRFTNRLYGFLRVQLDANLVEKRAGEILNGLGFTKETMHKAAKHFSGGWRMRVSLARALFISPQILLLDEPTNHLDMESCLWLEERLSRYPNTLVIISHSQDFMNSVCDGMIYMHNQRLKYFKGDYDSFVKVSPFLSVFCSSLRLYYTFLWSDEYAT